MVLITHLYGKIDFACMRGGGISNSICGMLHFVPVESVHRMTFLVKTEFWRPTRESPQLIVYSADTKTLSDGQSRLISDGHRCSSPIKGNHPCQRGRCSPSPPPTRSWSLPSSSCPPWPRPPSSPSSSTSVPREIVFQV